MMKNERACMPHGFAKSGKKHLLYNTWINMKARCLNENHRDFKNYGGRGIAVCMEWINSFSQFLEDMGERPEGMTLDRKDNKGDYTSPNTRWATSVEQNRNRRVTRPARLVAPDGIRFVIKKGCVHEFTKLMGLNSGRISQVLNGKTKQHKGWVGCYLGRGEA